MANTYYCDFLNGNDANTGANFGQRVKTLNKATTLASPGDTIRIMQSGNPTSIGNATWTNMSDTVTLASALTTTVTNCESNWTAATNVTCTSTSFPIRQGTNCQSTAIGSSFTTGKAAYFATGTLDLSAFQQISFWIQSSATITSGTLRVSLCSDTTGDTQVNNFDINFDIATANIWHPIVLDYGAALGASIKSIALYLLSDPGTPTIYLDNIFVSTAPSANDSITLNSLIGKNTGTETWWAIQSISGTTVILDKSPRDASNRTSKYIGSSQTVTTYKREMIQCAITTGDCQNTAAGGNSSNALIISGGWDTTNMSTQTGVTWIDGRTGQGTGFTIQNTYIQLDPNTLAASRFNKGFTIAVASANTTGGILGANNNNDNGVEFSTGIFTNFGDIIGSSGNTSHGVYVANGSVLSVGNIYNSHSNGADGVYLSNIGVFSASTIFASNNQLGFEIQDGQATANSVTTNNNSSSGLLSNGLGPLVINNLSSYDNTSYGFNLGNPAKHQIFTYSSSGNSSASIRVNTSSRWVEAYINDATISDSTVVSGFTDYKDQRICLQNRSGTLNNNIIYTDGGNIAVDTGDPHSVGGLDYTISITGTKRIAQYPIKFSIAKIAVNSGSQVTASVYIKKSHATDISAKLIVPGGQISGVPSDVSTTATSTSYAQYSVSFTPSMKGVVEVFVYVWSDTGSTVDYVRVADLSVTQV